MRACCGTSGRAFTLIELTLVLFIMAVFAAIAIPKFADATSRYRLDAAERRVMADVETAFARARATGVTHYVQFGPASDNYAVFTGSGGSLRPVTGVVLAAKPYLADIVSVTMSDSSNTLEIDGYGEAVNGASVTIAVGSSSRTLTLSEAKPAPEEGPGDDKVDEVIDLVDVGDLLDGILGGLGL